MIKSFRAPARRRLAHTLSLLLAGAVLPAAALAQTALTPDAPASGSLDASSSKADDGTPYALFEYVGKPGERIRVVQKSSAFDSFLAVGSSAAPGCSDDCKYDDDSGGELDASLTYTLPASGKAQIRANSVSPDASGAFSLSLTVVPAPAPARPQALRLDTETSGSLGDASARDDDDRSHDLWTVSGRRNQEVVVRVNSDDFDAFVEFGQLQRNAFTSSTSDDDGGSGLNARMTVSLDNNGGGAFKVTTPSGEGIGSYTVFVGDPPAKRPIVLQTINVGDSMRGSLTDTDSFNDEEIRFDAFKIEGRPGQRVVARLQSESFDPLLNWGVLDGERLMQESSDDDSGGGSTAQLSVTLDEDGVGRLVATGLDDTLGEYTLSIVGAPRPAGVER